jgi:uncharacterized protein involved in exopolysaccharide biosynthesis
MSHDPTAGMHDSDRVSPAALALTAWAGRRLILWVTISLTVVAVTAALLVTKTYAAYAVVAPATNANSSPLGGLGALASQFSGLASLAGISVPGDSKKYEYIAVLQSEELTEKYIADHNLLPVLFASKWDSVRGRWKSLDPSRVPTLWQGNQRFKKIRTVTTDAKTGLVTVSIVWKDANLAATWTNDLVKLTNDFLREKAINQAEADIAYLTEQANKTDVVAVRLGIYATLQGEINKIMTAKGTDEFALRIIDPAVPSEKPYSPQLMVWTLEGFVGGLILSLLIVVNRKQVAFGPA